MNSMITRWQRTATLAAMLVTAALASGCAIQAAVYQPSIANVEQIKKLDPQPIKVGTFQVKSGAEGASSISLRGNPMQSPVGGDYAAYLADALRQELVLAGKFKPDAGINVRGELLKNDIAAGGFSTNSGEIEARFIVLRGTEERYNSVLRASDSWDSSFIGAVAIPKAQQQYPVLVQKLLTTLFSDARFQAAIR